MDDGSGINGDLLVFSSGHWGSRGDHTERTEPYPYGIRLWGAPYSDIGSITSIEQMVHRLWGTDNGGLPGVHSGGMLVLCQS